MTPANTAVSWCCAVLRHSYVNRCTMAMTRWERKAALPHGVSTEIARRLTLTVGHVSQVVAGKRRDRRVEVAVARKIGRRVDEVFPPMDTESAA